MSFTGLELDKNIKIRIFMLTPIKSASIKIPIWHRNNKKVKNFIKLLKINIGNIKSETNATIGAFYIVFGLMLPIIPYLSVYLY
jgi:hypothetical protein